MLDSSPAFFAKDLLFPYEAGYDFVADLFERGGWDLIDQAYEKPPVSTEQILHPERYPDDLPIPVSLPNFEAIMGDGWREIDQNVMGEWYTYLILAHGLEENGRLTELDASEAAEGWGGDAYSVFYHTENKTAVMVLKTIWETPRDATEFINAFKDYARGRFGRPTEDTPSLIRWSLDSEIHSLYIEGAFTTWIIAPNLSQAEAVLNTIQNK